MKRLCTLFMAVLLCFVVTVPTYAYDFNGFGDIEPPVYDRDAYPYALFWRVTDLNDAYFYVLSFPVVMEERSVNQMLIPNGDGGSYLVFTYDKSTASWSVPDERTVSSDGWVVTSGNYVRWTNFDIYRSSKGDVEANNGSLWMDGDENFLIPPLAEVIQGVTAEEMSATLPQLVGTMSTLTLCGVGSMALLVVLSLFGRRSLIFRS